MKRFIDDIAVEVIEVKLVSVLSRIPSPVAVYEMSSELVALNACESEESCTQREQLEKQIDVLRKGSEICKRFSGVGLGGETCRIIIYTSNHLSPAQVRHIFLPNRTGTSILKKGIIAIPQNRA